MDRDTRVLDVVLTGNGRKLLSQGKLHLCYWSPFDDEVTYDPFIAQSGTMSTENLTASFRLSIETSPVREATTGYRSFDSHGSDHTNVHRPIFTMAQGQAHIPRTIFPLDVTGSIETKQRKVVRTYKDRDDTGKFSGSLQPIDIGVERFDPGNVALEFSYSRDGFPTNFHVDGFHVRIFKSGSSGLTEVRSKRDMSNDLSYGNDIRLFTGRRGG